MIGLGPYGRFGMSQSERGIDWPFALKRAEGGARLAEMVVKDL
jgi:hypothetical protein